MENIILNMLNNYSFKIDEDYENFLKETVPLLKPIPFWVNAYSLPDLFVGKVCVVLTRNWKKRIKERDWYDRYLYIHYFQ